MAIEQLTIKVDYVGAVHEDLIETQALHFPIPREAFEVFVEHLAGVAKPSEILAERDNNIWTDLFGLGDELQLSKASGAGSIVARNNDLFLLDRERQ